MATESAGGIVIVSRFVLSEEKGGVGVDLDISVDGDSFLIGIYGWPAWVNEYPDNPIDTSAGYSVVSEDGGWTSSGLLYCEIINKELILKWKPGISEKLGFPAWGPVALNMTGDDVSLLWQRLVDIFKYEVESPPVMEFK